MIIRKVNTEYAEFDNIEELNTEHQELMIKASEACFDAYSPYSGFRVGAAVKCEDGRIITGNNQENAAYPSGLCAERVAIFAAVSQKSNTRIKQIAIAVKTNNGDSKKPVAPCGACRQVIAEFEHRQGSKIEILFSAENGKTILINGIDVLLPFTFNADYLPEK